jgi:Ca2+-binding RTX toxin-like protein
VSTRRRASLIAGLSALALTLLWTGQAAAASTVTLSGGALTVTGDAGANDIAVGIDPGNPSDYRIADSSGISDPLPPECVRASATAIRCPVALVTFVRADVGAGDDQFKVSSGGIPQGVDLNVHGDEGNDTIRGRDGPGRDYLFGGDGDDAMFGEGGNDQMYGGAGNDEMDGGAGDDQVYGETGNDILTGGGGDDLVYGGKGKDVVNGLSEDDKLFGGSGNDKMSGGSGNDKGVGGGGKDSFNGGGGTDKGTAEKEKNVEK